MKLWNFVFVGCCMINYGSFLKWKGWEEDYDVGWFLCMDYLRGIV